MCFLIIWSSSFYAQTRTAKNAACAIYSGQGKKEIPLHNYFGNTGTYPCHFHRCYELITLIDGRPCSVFPNQLHSFTTLSQSLFNIVIFSPKIIGDFAARYPGCIPKQPISHPGIFTIEELLICNPFEQRAFLYHICAQYSEKTSTIKNPGLDEPILLRRILTFVGEHYQYSCTLQELSAHLGYEYTYLSKYFIDKMKLSYTAYLNQVRIRQACVLLRDKERPIVDIAIQCGYNTIRTFNRNFYSMIGKTPKEFREQLYTVP